MEFSLPGTINRYDRYDITIAINNAAHILTYSRNSWPIHFSVAGLLENSFMTWRIVIR